MTAPSRLRGWRNVMTTPPRGMAKSRSAAALTTLLLLAACAWPSPERQLLLDFFQACRVYDTTVLARLTTVPCNPRTDGFVQAFDVISVDRDTDARKVTIRAQVRSFEGPVSEQTVAVAMARRDGRWM